MTEVQLQIRPELSLDEPIDDTRVEELISLTQKEIFAYSNFLNQLLAQQCAIIDRDIIHLTDRTQRAEECSMLAKQLSEERKEIMLQVLAHTRPCKELATLEQVIPMVKRQYATRLKELREDLIEVLEEIKQTNRRTAFLLRESIRYVNRNLQIIGQELDQSDSYSTDGRVHKKNQLPVIFKIA